MKPRREKSLLERKRFKTPKQSVEEVGAWINQSVVDSYDGNIAVGSDLQLRAQHLAMIYQGLRIQRVGAGWEVKNGSKSYLSFVRVAQHIIEYEQSSCRRVNDIDYVMAHIWYWGEKCFTTRLHSSSSLALYDSFTRMKSATVVTLNEEEESEYEEKLLQFLSEIRVESIESVRLSLQSSGLLSKR